MKTIIFNSYKKQGGVLMSGIQIENLVKTYGDNIACNDVHCS